MPAGKLTTLVRLGAMFERTALVRDARDVQPVLEEVCRTIADVLGYGAVVVNVYRPAYDDMLTAAAVGSEESVRALLGRSSPADTWYPLLDARFERRGAHFVPAEEFDWDELGVETYVPDIDPPERPDAWRAEDALFVALRDQARGLIGVVSVDEPETGLRPGDDELDALVAIAHHAALALRMAQGTATDLRNQRMLEGVLEVSARLADADSTDHVLQAVCDGINEALGFDKVAIELAEEEGVPLQAVAASGWEMEGAAVNHGLPMESLAPLFTSEFEVAGCYLIPTEVAEERLGVGRISHRSDMNGHGPHAWSRHWLLVPLEERDGRRIGVIWAEDPRDRLLPSRDRLQALRLFANQAVAALRTADRAASLRYDALHDTLTGLPNRRAFMDRLLHESSHRDRSFALILCDMDNLKRVNDENGHEAGDRALQQLADALRTGLRRSDEAFRLGGDEFGVVVGGASRLDAERVARRLKTALAARHSAGKDIEASFGIAVHEPGEDPERLVARADEALYQAKRRARELSA
jgi:diguanylate cyclase (GGDEF)-like protein